MLPPHCAGEAASAREADSRMLNVLLGKFLMCWRRARRSPCGSEPRRRFGANV